MLGKIAKAQSKRTGNILIVILIVIVPLMGFGALAVDYGVLINDKNRLQRACDAAALAAAQELKVSNDSADTQSATAMAIATAKQNGVTVTAGEISFSNDNCDITVNAKLTRNLFLARVLGITKGNTAASATASVTTSSPGYTPYVSPIGITASTYSAYKDSYKDSNPAAHGLKLIRHQKEAFGKDDFVLYDLRQQNSKSGKWMYRQLIGTDKEPITIIPDGAACSNITTYCQTSLDSSKTSETKKFKDGIDELIAKAAGSPWFDPGGLNYYYNMKDGLADYSNPRVLNIIVTNDYPTYNVGSTNMPVKYFVPVYIDGYDGDTGILTVRFLPPGSAANGDILLPGDDGDATTGVRTVRLLD